MCGKQHEGGWKKCNQITKTVRTNISKLVDASAFDDTSSNGGNKHTTAKSTGG